MAVSLSLLLLLLGILLGANLVFAAVLMPAVFRMLPVGMARAFIRSVFSLFYLFAAGLSGAALALLTLQTCLPVLSRIVIALCCVGYVLAWLELTPRLVALRDRGDSAALKRMEGAAQVLNTAQMAVITAVYLQLLRACA